MDSATYTKVSDLTVSDLTEYLRIVEVDPQETSFLNTVLEAAKNYAVSETGLGLSVLDNYPEITLAVLAIAQDLYDNRSVYVDKSNVSETISTILGLHRINLL